MLNQSINSQNREKSLASKKAKVQTRDLCHTIGYWKSKGIVNFGCLHEKKIKFVDGDVNKIKLEERS